MKLGLGTVQFGLNYGISNTVGQTPRDAASAILQHAAQHDITCLDTAPAYGDSEHILGQSLWADHPFRLVTKTNPIQANTINASHATQIEQDFARSCNQLGPVDTLLVHHPVNLIQPGCEYVYDALCQLKARGLVQRIGVSVYTAQQIDRIMARFPLDVVQLPLNVFDQRLVHSGHVDALARAGVEVHVRSVFLQGLLLMERPPAHLVGLTQAMEAWQRFCVRHELSPVAAALSFVNTIPAVSLAIVGINSLEQWQGIVQAYQAINTQFTLTHFAPLAVEDPNLIDPSLWHQLAVH
jgi:aryl-alcohol dehydrogenase-like predicted oxidoreductase